MNYLAHAYLSFNNPDILIGNMINDYIKGKQQYDYTNEIQNGFRLHRFIDQYTDHHPATKEGAKLMSKAVGRYGNALMDVVYDHFLANDIHEFKYESDLNNFAQKTYLILEERKLELPEVFRQILSNMQENNWLYNYRKPEGIEKSFKGVRYRSTHLKSTDSAFSLFEMEYEFLKECFYSLWVDIKPAAYNEFQKLLTNEL